MKIEKEMVEYWTKDTKVFKEVQNMPARTKIIAAYPSLSPAERQAADFILSDPDAVPHLSIKQIAARAGVSMPTVTRIVAFAQHAKAIFADFWAMQHRHRLLRLRKLYSRSRRDMREKFRRTHTGEECSEQLKGNINKMRIIEDLHTHTYYSHGKNGPRDNVLRALELGLEAVAVSEHAGGNMYYGVRGKKLERLNAELAELRREFDGRIRVLRGLECNVMNFGESDIPKDRSEYDVIILGYHKGIPPVNRFARHILFESFGGKSTPRRNTESLMAAAEKGHADIISHPNLYLTLDIPYLADCARQLGILLEINSSHVSLTPEEIKTIHEHGAGLIIGSDAHVSSRVGDFANGIEFAKQAGVLNSVVNIEL